MTKQRSPKRGFYTRRMEVICRESGTVKMYEEPPCTQPLLRWSHSGQTIRFASSCKHVCYLTPELKFIRKSTQHNLSIITISEKQSEKLHRYDFTNVFLAWLELCSTTIAAVSKPWHRNIYENKEMEAGWWRKQMGETIKSFLLYTLNYKYKKRLFLMAFLVLPSTHPHTQNSLLLKFLPWNNFANWFKFCWNSTDSKSLSRAWIFVGMKWINC